MNTTAPTLGGLPSVLIVYGDPPRTAPVVCRPTPVTGLLAAPAVNSHGQLTGGWTLVHAASGLVLNDPRGFTGRFDTLTAALTYAASLGRYFPDTDFTADAATIREHLRRDPSAMTEALHVADRAEQTTLTDALSRSEGLPVHTHTRVEKGHHP